MLTGSKVTLRELEVTDAPSLLSMLTTEEVSRFISPPPTTVEGFERFIRWAHAERAAGRYVCFAVVPHGMTTAVGLFQVRQLEPGSRRRNGASRSARPSGARASSSTAASWSWTSRRDARRRPARGARGSGQRPRQRRAAQAGRGAGRRAAPVVPQERPAPGPDAVVDPGRGMALGPRPLGAAASFTNQSFVPTRVKVALPSVAGVRYSGSTGFSLVITRACFADITGCLPSRSLMRPPPAFVVAFARGA